MSVANYDVSANNHAEILICIQTVGNLQENDLIEACTKIRKHSKLVIADAGRTVRFRFEVDSSPENSKWGFFQPHRRVMGLLVLAACSTAMEVALLHETFQKQKDAFANFIFDARCFVFGVQNTFHHQQSKSDVFQFIDVQSWKLSDSDIKDFLTSVFYVLESKRLQMAADKSDRPNLLTAPFEKNQANSSDNDSRTYRKKCFGRWKKHLADISLLAGLKLEALQNYHLSLEYLTAINDPVWVGGAIEGLCVTSSITLFGVSKSIPKSPIHQNLNKQVLDPRNLVSSKLSSPELAKQCIQEPNDFVDQYKEAVINYSRNENMGIVELEACIKATKVMAVLRKFIQAAEFLQNAVYIALNVSDKERIIKYSVLADLYADINFHRKSAFYRRVAAMQCVSPHLQHPDWKKCYGLLQGTWVGYELNFLTDSGLPLPPNECDETHGWPQVKIRVLHELIFSARKTGRTKFANRYSLYLLMRLHKYLSEVEEKDVCVALSSSKRNDTMKFSDQVALPSVHMYNLPTVSEVEPQPLSERFNPSLVKSIEEGNSVFLFTPASYQSVQENLKQIDFNWCVNCPGHVQLTLLNPLRVHCLRASEVRLICEGKNGATFVCPSLNIEIPPSSSVSATLQLLPKSEGTVVITGYEITVFGVRSQCYFRSMPWIPVDEFKVDIIVELPMLEGENSCLSPAAHSKNRMMITLYRGETRLLEVPLTCSQNIPVSYVEVIPKPPALANDETSFTSIKRQKSQWLRVTCDDVRDQLPVEPGKYLLLPVIMMTEAKSTDVNDKYPICTCLIKIKYSSDEGLQSNWCRSSSVQLNASLKSCIDVGNVTVKHSTKQSYCVVVVELVDVSEDDVIICSANLNEVNLLKQDGKEFEYEDGRLIVAKLYPDDVVTVEVEIPTVSMDQDTCVGDDCCRIMQDVFSEKLALEWIIKDDTSSRSGLLDLSSCNLDISSIDNLITAPLQWKMYISDEMVELRRAGCDLGSAVPLRITMKNITSDVITLIDVELEVFQDQENGFLEWNMEDNVLCVGCQSQSFCDVNPDEEVCFECGLVFLLRGDYHVRLRRAMKEVDSLLEQQEQLTRTRNHHVTHKHVSPLLVISAQE